MKVLHVGEYVSGGVATYLREVLDFQSNSTDITEVNLIMSSYKSENISLQKCNVYTYTYKRNFGGILKGIFSINKYIREFKPDIIHIHSTFAGVITRFLLCFYLKEKVRVVYCSHGWSFLIEGNKIKKRLYAIVEKMLASLRTDLIINISDYEFKGALNIGINSNILVKIYNGIEGFSIDEKQFNLRVKDINKIFNEEKLKVLFVGRFDKSKGIDILLDLFQKYKFPNLELYLIGDSVLGDNELNIPKNVKHLGWVNHKDLSLYYDSCDIVIVPSRWEGFGLVAIEAMKHKKPLIVSNRGALPELVEDKINGYIFDLEDLDELKNILLNLDKEEIYKMGIVGYKKFKENFTSDVMNKSILEEYKKLIK